ncbi:putative two-component system sensor histidine kinase, putative heat shock protein [hydrothermal vent metagenome]|uniref:Putative two-component system sensor histidine kinase, putative heat shock protein n=1 Tax=hydrothermal vent metagenome TaxID=652676 RepID=A0A3B1BYM3_9ZZZZ
MGKSRKYFKVSSALKNVIGKDLITDDFVAIFELVKNSFDANSKRVDVIFRDVNSEISSVLIKDNGKGMDLKDIEDKWLFVAYSAKKEGTEDYRNEIKSKRIHAGAKGIGRFSCDRLGRNLIIYSRRNSKEQTSKLTVAWEDFEKNIHDKFEKIPVAYELVDSCPYDLKTGTILEISNLRSKWGIEKFVTLRQSLEKLVNPSQANATSSFSIYLRVDEFKNTDKEEKAAGKDFRVINGKIKNFLFEKLELKTTRIDVVIDENGESITTELYDRGRFVYRMVEENPYLNKEGALSNIRILLFSMNQVSKAMFTKYMGVRPVNFGSVFVYKNGFRIHPIGEIGRGDVFGLDGRKQQGTSRFFGTRDLFGRIEINGENIQFQEASSRDGGLERNEAFYSLKEFFTGYVLKRLERYAIGVVKYGNIDDINITDLSANFPKEKALEFIEALTKSGEIHDIEFNPEIFDVVSDSSEKSLRSLMKNLSRIVLDSNNPELENEINKIEGRLNDFAKASKDAEGEARQEKARRKRAEKQAREDAERVKEAENEVQRQREESELITKQSIFLRSIVSSDLENVVALHHHIGIAAGTIENYVRNVSKKIRSGKPITAETFLSVLDEISFVARQISATTRFATKANFNLEAELISKDLCAYIEEYVLNICSGLIKIDGDIYTDMKFNWVNSIDKEFEVEFRPLEISMVLDSLINNSVKAKARKVLFSAMLDGEYLVIKVADDGKGIKESIRDKIFDMGFTTTNGSGLGLHHARNILKSMNGDIELSIDASKRTEFVLKFTR